MKKYFALILAGVLALGFSSGSIFAEINAVTPSTNDINRTNGWAHVNQLSMGVGTTDLEFISTRGFLSCFEYRTDGDISQKIGDTNYNTDVTDGLYPYYCQNNNSRTVTINANEYVEIRMVFGAERDERFDWTRFDVLYPRSAEITSPVAGEEVSGIVSFEAYLDDNDVDAIQWAIRQGTCAANTNTVFGNVDGHSDTATIDASDLSHQAFSFSADMSSLPLGMYCFVYNPVEDSGESNIRKTVEFHLKELLIGPPTDKDQCKKDGWKTFNDPFFKNQGDCVSYVQSNENAKGNRKDN
jgi:hypothetical protein